MGIMSRQIMETSEKYKSVVATRRGSPEVLEIVENDLRAPAPREARVRILACCVCLPDVQARYGQSPFAPKMPFVPGYAIVGVVDALGDGVSNVRVGDRVGALTVYGGYAEYIYLAQGKLFPVSATLDPAEAVALILNYIVAFQALHRSAKVKAGDTVLIIGASGGCGTAFLDLCKLAGLKMYGIASGSKHHILAAYGAVPIDYRTQDFVKMIRDAEPDGLDAVFNGMGEDYLRRGFSLLRRGGRWIAYGNTLSVSGTLRLLGWFILLNLLPNGRSLKLYGAGSHIFDRRPFLEDWDRLFKLLEEGRIRPVIMKRFPILEAAKANRLLESGEVIGNLVLLTPELLEPSQQA
jgi:NADPH:quinone reductase-like Zn-dependent oxidoreductase